MIDRSNNWVYHCTEKIKYYFLSGFTLSVVTFGVYLRTVAPGVWGFDSAELASGVYSLGIVHPPGYPLYILIGKLFITFLPGNNIAYKLNILSAIFASGTVFLLYEIIFRTTHHRTIAWSSSAYFAFTNYFWQMALVTEVYTLHTFFLALIILLILSQRRRPKDSKLILFAFLFGLSLCNSTSGILFAFGYIWLLFSQQKITLDKWYVITLMFIVFISGLLLYFYLPVRELFNPQLNYAKEYPGISLNTIQGVYWMFSGQAYQFYVFGYNFPDIPGEIFHFISYLWRNFLGIGVIIGLVGIYFNWRMNWKLTLGWLSIFSFNVIFFTNYRVVDKDTMFLPAFLIWTLFMASGLESIIAYFRKLTGSIIMYPINQKSIASWLVLLPLIPFIFNYKWVDMSSKNGAELFAAHVFENTSPNSVIIGEWSSSVILEYYQIVEGKRPDLLIYNRSRTQTAQFYENWNKGISYQENIKIISTSEINSICSIIQNRKLYIIEYDPALEMRFEFKPNGEFFEIKPKSDNCN